MREKVTLDFSKDELAGLVKTHPAIVALLGEPEEGYEVSVVINAQKVVITSEKETTLPGTESTTPEDTAEAKSEDVAEDELGEGDELALGEGTSEAEAEPVPLTEEELDIGSNDNVEPTDDDDFLGEVELGLDGEEEEPEGSSPAFTEY